jgi:EAL domain-containing protein (putative c-di-GMP-specific phosphodiesterase class I)
MVVPSQNAAPSADHLSRDHYNAALPAAEELPAEEAPFAASPEPPAPEPAAALEDDTPEHTDHAPTPEDYAAADADLPAASEDHAPEHAAHASAPEDRAPVPADPTPAAQSPVAPVTSASSVIPPSPAQPPPAAPRPPGHITTIARDSATTAGMDDRAWLKLLRSALIENRFRLVQHPISSLHGEDPSMFEVLLRLLDPVGREILPDQFEGPAERHDMLKNIDRWVVGASLSFVAQRRPGCLFVRLSGDTARDDAFISWIDNQLRVGQAQPERLCFQVPEAIASETLKEVREMSEALRERGFRFAIESFGTRPESLELLEHVPVDFVKIDGTLMGSVAHSAQTLEQVRKLVDAAGQRFIMTIGENVQDSDTMAVLWEVGMQYVQASFAEQPLERAGR